MWYDDGYTETVNDDTIMADLVTFSGKFPFFLTFYGKSFINYYKRHSEDFSILMLKMFINRHFKELSSTY